MGPSRGTRLMTDRTMGRCSTTELHLASCVQSETMPVKFVLKTLWLSHPGSERQLRGKSVDSLCDGSSDRYFMVDPLSYFWFQPVLHNWRLIIFHISLISIQWYRSNHWLKKMCRVHHWINKEQLGVRALCSCLSIDIGYTHNTLQNLPQNCCFCFFCFCFLNNWHYN